MVAEDKMEERILEIVLANVQNNNKSINIRFDAMMESLRNNTAMLEGKVGLLKGEIVDFRHSMDSKIGFIEADMKKMRNDIKKNHEDILDLMIRKFKLD